MTPRRAGIAALVVALVAVYLVVPPITLRTPVPSVLLALAAGGLAIFALRGEERRYGWTGLGFAAVALVLAFVFTDVPEERLARVFVWSAIGAAMLRYAAPLILAALGGVISERAGVINIGLEGMMLVGAFFGVWGADVSGSWVAGILTAMVAGGLVGVLHAVFTVTLKSNQIVTGVAINFLALGATGYLLVRIFGLEGTPPDLPQVPDVRLPIESVPLLGGMLRQQDLLVWVALALVALTTVYLFHTAKGLRHRAVGENPLAADTAGIAVNRTRYLAVIASGVLAALGGAALSIGFVNSFSENLTAGNGFIALAAMIFGRWHPVGAMAAALLFGASTALAFRLEGLSPTGATLFQALPYLLTLVAVAGLVGRARPPAADGVPYVR